MTACSEKSRAGIGEEAGKSEHKTSFLSLLGRRQERQRVSTQRLNMVKSNKYKVADLTEDLDSL